MAEDYDFLFKSVVVGDGGSGKTAVVVRFSQGFFQENYKLTIGVEFAVKTIHINNYNVKLQIWDTGGQERFRYVRPLYYKGSMGCIILFDLTNRESFDHVPKWLEEVKKESGNIPILLVGNKSDLINERAVSLDEAKQISKDLNMFYVESSAKNGNGVGDVFAILSLLMIGEDIPPEMLSSSFSGESDIKQSISKTKSSEKKKGNKPISSLKPSPISSSVVKPSPISNISKDRKEPEWFAPAVSPKPKPEPKPYIPPEPKPEPKPYIPPEPKPELYIPPEPKPELNPFFTPKPKQESKPFMATNSVEISKKPEPKPYIPPEPKPELNPFFAPKPKQESKPFMTTYPVEIKKKPENQDLFLSEISKDPSPKSKSSNFFAPSVPKKPSLNQVKKIAPSISSNPFLTQNREPILPKGNSSLAYGTNEIYDKKSKKKDKSSILFNSLKDTNSDDLKKESKGKSSWGFMSNVNKPSSSEKQVREPLPFKSSKQNFMPQQEKESNIIKLKCPRCGSLVNKHFKFCNKCGNRI